MMVMSLPLLSEPFKSPYTVFGAAGGPATANVQSTSDSVVKTHDPKAAYFDSDA